MRDVVLVGTLALCTALGGGCSAGGTLADGDFGEDEGTDGNAVGEDEGTTSETDEGGVGEDGDDSYESSGGDDTSGTTGGGDGEWNQ